MTWIFYSWLNSKLHTWQIVHFKPFNSALCSLCSLPGWTPRRRATRTAFDSSRCPSTWRSVVADRAGSILPRRQHRLPWAERKFVGQKCLTRPERSNNFRRQLTSLTFLWIQQRNVAKEYYGNVININLHRLNYNSANFNFKDTECAPSGVLHKVLNDN